MKPLHAFSLVMSSKSLRTWWRAWLVVALFGTVPSRAPGADNFYISDVGNNSIWEYTPGNAPAIYYTAPAAQGSVFGIANDPSGNIYYSALGTGNIYENKGTLITSLSRVNDKYPQYLTYANLGGKGYLVASNFNASQVNFISLASGHAVTTVTLTGGTFNGVNFAAPINSTGLTVNSSAGSTDLWVLGSSASNTNNGSIIHYSLGLSGSTPTLTFQDGLPHATNQNRTIDLGYGLAYINSGTTSTVSTATTQLFFSDWGSNHMGWWEGNASVNHYVGNSTGSGFIAITQPTGLAIDKANTSNTSVSLYVLGETTHSIYNVTGSLPNSLNEWTISGALSSAFNNPIGIVDNGTTTAQTTLPRTLAEPLDPAPEPTSLILFALSGLGLAGYRHATRKRTAAH